jgi:SAM-dependent methyltransferase
MDVWDRLGTIEADRVLDVGCGLGGSIARLVAHLGRCRRVTAVDVVEEYGPRLRERFPGLDLEYRTMAAERLAFADAAFDVASISYALHHVKDPAAALAQMRRVLRPGGWLIVAEPHADATSEAQRTDVLVHGWRARVDTLLGGRHNQTFTREAVAALVARLGLPELEILDYAPTDRDKTAARALEEIAQHLAGLGGVDGAEAARLREEGRSLEERVRRTGVEAAPALLLLGRV